MSDTVIEATAAAPEAAPETEGGAG